MIPYSRQQIDRNDIKSVIKVLKSDYLTQGPIVKTFEESIAEYCDSKYAVATNSATSALHIACLALGVKKGDIVWTSANSFVASANCALYCGATIDFVDIDPLTFNMSIELLKKKLEQALESNCLPRVIIPVHFAGRSCDMKQIYELSIKYGFSVIEDASHALGGRFTDYPVGNCKYSDVTIFSFHPVKIITTGEGGAATTNSPKIANKMIKLRSHGIERDLDHFEPRATNEIWNYQQIHLGFNYRMSDINAALGLSQLSKLDKFITKRNNIAQKYNGAMQRLGIIPQKMSENIYSSYHLYPARFKESEFGKTQKVVFYRLKSAGIEANIHYIPIHRHPYFEKLGFKEGDFPESESFFKEVISLPVFPSLKNSQQSYIIKILEEIRDT